LSAQPTRRGCIIGVVATSTETVGARLERRGFAVVRAVVPPDAVERALRHVHLALVREGLPADRLGAWLWDAHWFPHLKWDEPIVGLTAVLPPELREGTACDPQILLHPPDDCDEVELTSHVDVEPPWADGRTYLRIVGVALSAAGPGDGGLVVWPFDDAGPEPLELEAGDAVVMHPRLPHTSGLNRHGRIRYAVYFRFLADDAS
jgi:hypothetical protein